MIAWNEGQRNDDQFDIALDEGAVFGAGPGAGDGTGGNEKVVLVADDSLVLPSMRPV